MLPWRVATVAACVWLGVLAAGPVTVAAESEDLASLDAFLDRVLETSASLDPSERDHYRQVVESEVRRVVERLGPGRPTYRRARRLHRLLHRRYLREYDPTADDVTSILEQGRYNCLSATLFYGLIARELGFRPRVVEIPGHVYLRLRINHRRSIEVETTDRDGFDVGPRHALTFGDPGRAIASGWAGMPLLADAVRSEEHPHVLSLEQTLSFVWLNSAWRSLRAGDTLRAAEAVRRAHSLFPEQDSHDDAVQLVLSRAFAAEYQAGRFDTAYRIAGVDVSLFPGATLSRDRLLASASKRIQLASESGRPAGGEAILRDVAGRIPPAQLRRLERRVCPTIAAAAVRVGDWEVARRAAERYAVADPDPVESDRLRRWIESRRSSDAGGDASCWDPPPLMLRDEGF